MRIGSVKLVFAAVALVPIAGVWSKQTLHRDPRQEEQLQNAQSDRKLGGQAEIGVRSSHGSEHNEGGGNSNEKTERTAKASKASSGRPSHGGNGEGRSQYYAGGDQYYGHSSGGGGGGSGGHYYGSGGGSEPQSPDEPYYGGGGGGSNHGGGNSGGYYGSEGGHGGGSKGGYYDAEGGNGGGNTGGYYGSGSGNGESSKGGYYGSEGGNGGGNTGEYYGSGSGTGGGSSNKPYPYSDDNYYDDYFIWESPQNPNDPYSDDNYYDDYFIWSDDKMNKNPGYDDYFQYPSWDDYTPGHDDFFVSGDDNYYPPSNGGGGSGKGGGKGDGGKGGGGKGGKSGKSSKYCKNAKKGQKGGKGSKGGYHYYECEDDDNLPGYDDWWIPYDDIAVDDFHLDDTYFFLPRPVATIWGEAFSPQTTIPPVTPNPLVPDTAELGTMYLYTNWTANVQDIDLFEIPVFVDGEEVIIWISLDGYCTRFGTPENSAQGYCHFTYTVYDPESLLISGSFAAEGFLVDATRPGEFTIIGGTGILTGASGIIEVSPAILDSSMDPPLVVSPPEGADIFDGLAGYMHYFEVEADLFFFMPDLYYTGNAGKDDSYYNR